MKILQYKLNAIMAKSRAIYGRRLTAKDYESLINCSSVSEISSYLRSSPSYAGIFEKVSPSEISAGYLEFLIRKNNFEIFEKLYRYEVAFGQELYNYFVRNGEITLILSRVRSIILGNTIEQAASMPQLYVGSLELDMEALSKVKTMDELVTALEGTPYKKIISQCLKNNDSEYVDYECALNNYFNEFEYELIKKCCGRNNELIKLLSSKADMEFADKLYRMKKYFPLSSDRTQRSIVPTNLTNFTAKQIQQLISAQSSDDVLNILSMTSYREYAEKIRKSDYAEQAIAQLNYKKYKHLLRFSTQPDEVMFCFMFLIENEVTNLIHIIEGIKYKMDAGSIKALLIGVGD